MEPPPHMPDLLLLYFILSFINLFNLSSLEQGLINKKRIRSNWDCLIWRKSKSLLLFSSVHRHWTLLQRTPVDPLWNAGMVTKDGLPLNYLVDQSPTNLVWFPIHRHDHLRKNKNREKEKRRELIGGGGGLRNSNASAWNEWVWGKSPILECSNSRVYLIRSHRRGLPWNNNGHSKTKYYWIRYIRAYISKTQP